MIDPRYTKLAAQLLNYSVELRAGQNLLIDAYEVDSALVQVLVEQAALLGGCPFVRLRNAQVTRQLLQGTSVEFAKRQWQLDRTLIESLHAYIQIRGSSNVFENNGVPSDQLHIQEKWYGSEFSNRLVNDTNWVVLQFPTPSFAQRANMSTESFEDFYFNVSTLDYSKMDRAMAPLVELMDRTDRVRLVGEGVDLTFSIQGIGSVPCSGKRNIPDGEVFTAPVRDSINGVLTYNTMTNRNGISFSNVRFVFEDGKIVEATANQTKELNKILDTDEGARFIGEFAIGFNPYILHPMNDTLFDEKIAGSFHFTPGKAYQGAADNGNRSQIHWDMVSIQRPEYGGGEIWFDNRLIRKDGLFVLPELEGLNPAHLV
ncbi:MAG: aminopeptidase [Bacilli bacterium]|nr:aminopeptidase [Bacilli bacterium]